MVGWLDDWMVRWMDGWIVGWLDGWMDSWMDGWMDGCLHTCLLVIFAPVVVSKITKSPTETVGTISPLETARMHALTQTKRFDGCYDHSTYIRW